MFLLYELSIDKASRVGIEHTVYVRGSQEPCQRKAVQRYQKRSEFRVPSGRAIDLSNFGGVQLILLRTPEKL